MSHYKYGRLTVFGALAILALLLTATCNLQPVSTIRLKASPELYLPLGSKQFDTNTLFKKLEEEMLQSISSDTFGKPGTATSDTQSAIYRYTDPKAKDSDQLKYLAHYSVQSFTFNVGSYFGKTSNTGTAVLSRKFDTSISIPAIAQTEKYKIPTETIHNELVKTFNKEQEHEHKKLPIPSGQTGRFSPPSVTIGFTGFNRLTFGDFSYLTISTHPAVSATVQYRIRTATLTANGKTIAGRTDSWDGHQITFPLGGETISNTPALSMELEIISGSGNIIIERKLSGTIKKAEGVNTELDDISFNSGELEIPLPKDFQRATIGEGSMNLSLTQPSEWQNISMAHKTAVVQSGSGGLSINPSGFIALGQAQSLAGVQLNNNPKVTYTPLFKVSLHNATYTYDPREEVFANFAFMIKNFTAITLKNKDDFSKVQREPAPANMRDWIKSIDITRATATVSLQNGLPAGNNVDISLKSDAFHISEQKKTFEAQQKQEQKYESTQNFSLNITPTTLFDLTTKVILPGYNASEDTFTLHNINTGSTLSFTGNVDFDLDWTKMMVKAENQEVHTFPQNGFFHLSLITKLKDTHISWDKIPLYMYAGSNTGLFNGAKVNVSLGAEYFTEKNPQLTPIVLGSSETHTLTPLPENLFPKDTKDFTGPIPPPLRHVESLEQLINKYPEGFRFTYTLSMPEGIPITREQYEKAKKEKEGKEEVKLNVDMLLEVPLGFTAEKGGGELPLASLTGEPAPVDFFGRDGILSSLPFDKQQVTLRKVRVETQLKNDTAFNPIFVLAAHDKEGKTAFKKEMSLAPGRHSLDFSDEDLETIKKISPFVPELYLRAAEGHHIVKKGQHLTVAIGAAVKADIDIPLLGDTAQQPGPASNVSENTK